MKAIGLKVKVKRVRGDRDREIPFPRYMTEHSSGMDLFAAIEEEVTLEPGERKLIPTGIALSIPEGYEGQVRPRSGLASTKWGHAGEYSGDHRCRLPGRSWGFVDQFWPTAVHGEAWRPGRAASDRPGNSGNDRVVDELDDTPRSAGGFGHTGA